MAQLHVLYSGAEQAAALTRSQQRATAKWHKDTPPHTARACLPACLPCLPVCLAPVLPLQVCATCAMLLCASSSRGTPNATCSSAQHRAPRQNPTSGGETHRHSTTHEFCCTIVNAWARYDAFALRIRFFEECSSLCSTTCSRVRVACLGHWHWSIRNPLWLRPAVTVDLPVGHPHQVSVMQKRLLPVCVAGWGSPARMHSSDSFSYRRWGRGVSAPCCYVPSAFCTFSFWRS